jgi:quinol monooxygenase YgiN
VASQEYFTNLKGCLRNPTIFIHDFCELAGNFGTLAAGAQLFDLKINKEMKMVRSTIRMLIPLEKQSEALEILGSTIEQTQFEPGCINCRIYRGVEDVRAVMLEELWTSGEDVQRHLRSEKYRKILLVVEMAEESPEIRFDTIAESSGVETIEKAREQI